MGKPRKVIRFILSLILTKALGLSSIATPMLGPMALAPPAIDPGWTFKGSLNTRRNNHTATLLPNGKALVAGGNAGADIQGILSTAELYDPATGTWSLTGSPSAHPAGSRVPASRFVESAPTKYFSLVR